LAAPLLPGDVVKAKDWARVEQLCREALATLD